MEGEVPALIVHEKAFAEIAGWQEFKVETGFANQCFRQRLIEHQSDSQGVAVNAGPDRVVELVLRIPKVDLDRSLILQSPLFPDGRSGIPLHRRRAEPDISVSGHSHIVMDDFDGGDFRVTEGAVVPIVEYQIVETCG
ncbi:MAG: hypothetical protein BWY82_03018 [Verrucomicrobia bacterium ADurb.Bin474]|nr:MAG: hypothetical protein BWY82_03018 [Verrucomicrobia bacterium ADurb.Bin474]